MRRITVSLVLALMLLAAPAAVTAHGPSSDFRVGSFSASWCGGQDCGDHGPSIDPNGLAARHATPGTLTLPLGWLEAFLRV